MIIDELQKANIEALKTKNKAARAVLSVVINRYKLEAIEMNTNGKEITDKEMTRIISKVLKELDEEKEGYKKVNRIDDVNNIDLQIEVISKYLPKLLSEEEIRLEISKLEDKSLPNIMKHFKTHFDGQVDMGLVNKIARTL